MELVEIGSNISEEQQLLEIIKERQSSSNDGNFLRKVVLHSNHLSRLSIECLLPWANTLVHLDLSSNSLESMASLAGLVNLKYLNLSNNRISDIEGLQGMTSLLWLDLSFNRLISLAGLCQVHGTHFQLEYLDIKCNRISEFREFYQLVGIPHLSVLIFSDEEPTNSDEETILMDNPCCNQKNQIRAYLFKALKSVKIIDGQDEKGNGVSIESYFENIDYVVPKGQEIISTTMETNIIDTENIARQIADKINHGIDGKIAEIKEANAATANSDFNQIESEFKKLNQELQETKSESQSTNFENHRLADLNERLKLDVDRLNENLLESKQRHEHLLKTIQEKDERIRLLSSEHDRQIYALKQQIDHETMKTVQLKHQVDVAHSNAEAIADKYEDLDRCYSETKQNLDSTLNAVRMEKVKNERFSFKLEKTQDLLKQKEILIKEIEDANIHKISQITSQKDSINKLQSDISDLTIRHQNDKELHRSNLDALQEKYDQLKNENDNLRTQLTQVTKSFDETLREMKESHEKEIINIVERVAHEMKEKYSSAERDMRKDFHAYKNAYETLENEFKIKISKETERSKKLQSKVVLLQQAALHLQEESDRVNSLNERMQSHHQESNNLILDQKRELESLRKTVTKQTQLIASLKEKVKTLKSCKVGNDDGTMVRIRSYQEKLEAKDEELFKIARRLRELEEDATRLTASESMTKELTSKLENLEKSFNKVSEERDILQQAIMMKNKMIDEHIETNRAIKQDLMKRTAELARLSDQVVMRERQAEETVQREKALTKELQQEFRTLEKRESKMERHIEKLTEERETLRKEVQELDIQLRDRNNLISIIEEEVSRLKTSLEFEKASLKEQYQQKQEAMEARCKELQELVEKGELDRERIAELKKKISDYSILCESQEEEIIQLKKEIKVLLVEMENQKAVMTQKLTKVKAAMGF